MKRSITHFFGGFKQRLKKGDPKIRPKHQLQSIEEGEGIGNDAGKQDKERNKKPINRPIQDTLLPRRFIVMVCSPKPQEL
jgi:hypothetical protein